MTKPMNRHRVIFGDSRHMIELADRSVHLIVTSPPYWCIKDYTHPDQIGYSQAYGDYLSDLRKVLSECHRVLHRGCRAAINIGDQYLRASEHGRYRVQPIPADIILMGQEIGFDYMGSIIWRKVSTTNTTGGGQWMGSIYHPRDGHVTYEHEYIILLRKRGQWPRPTDEQKEKSRLTKQQRSEWFRGVWEIQPARQDEHAAMFPVEIPKRLIKMYSYYGETILDPFLGSGTTCLAAGMEGRLSVGYEINSAFEREISRKLGLDAPNLLGGVDASFERRACHQAQEAPAKAARAPHV